MSADDDVAEHARRLRECVDKTVSAVEEMIDLAKHEYGHSVDEAMLHIREYFEQRASRVVLEENEFGARCDYAAYCAALIVLSETQARVAALEDAVQFRDSVINILGEIDEL